MIAGFIFLRLRGILGKRTGFDGKTPTQFQEVLKNVNLETKANKDNEFDERAQSEFLNGAKIAYETIITDFSDNDNKITNSKPLLSEKIYNQFDKALKERDKRGHFAEITFIGINSAKIKDHKKIDKALQVTVDFVGEIITCIRDKDKKIVSGDPDKIKKIYDTWVFSRDIRSNNPNWQLVDTLTQLNKKISEKDKKDWENFISKNEKLENKDKNFSKEKNIKIRLLDLHGYSLDDANIKIKQFIEESFAFGSEKLIIITGKGIHSQNDKDPYTSQKLGILKYSVPDFLKNNLSLSGLIKEITPARIEDGGEGAFYVYLRKKK